MKQLWKVIILRPYENTLLTASSSVWLYFMGVLVLFMASVEGFTWGTISYFMIPSKFRPLCIIVGLMVFCLIWILDAQIVTLDMSGTPKKDDANDFMTKLKLFFGRYSPKIIAGIIIRIFFITASVYITAPLLGTLLLTSDINNELSKLKGEIRSNLKNQLLSNDNQKTSKIDQTIQQLNAQLAEEVAGTSGSGKYGYGDVAKTLEKQLKFYNGELEKIKKEQNNLVNFVDAASEAELTSKYGVKFPANTYNTIKSLQDKIAIEDKERISQVQLLAKVFVIGIFLAILLIKLFQPKGIRIYLDDYLQSLYIDYSRHLFDDRIDEKEICNGIAPMSPYRFTHWVYNVYKLQEVIDHNNYIINGKLATYRKIIKEFDTSRKLIQNNINTIRLKREGMMKANKETSNKINELTSEQSDLRQVINNLDTQISELERQNSRVMSDAEIKMRIKQFENIEKQKESNLKSLKELTDKLHKEELFFEGKEGEIEAIDREILEAEKKLQDVQHEISKIENHIVNEYKKFTSKVVTGSSYV